MTFFPYSIFDQEDHKRLTFVREQRQKSRSQNFHVISECALDQKRPLQRQL